MLPFRMKLTKTEYLMTYIMQFQSKHPSVNDLVYINSSRHLARKYARIFVRGHYLFREANSFPRAKLEENCELRGTDNVQGQISEHIFAPIGDYCLYYPSNLFRNVMSTRSFNFESFIAVLFHYT